MKQPGYLADFDAARGLLMALGIVLHTANLFEADGLTPAASVAAQEGFAHLSESIHLFRMPAFFFLSGFFCAMSLTKMAPGALISRRALRLLVPCASAFVAFNVLDLWVRYGGTRGGWRVAAEDPLLHLWFLVVLFVYIAITATVVSTLGGRLSARQGSRLPHVRWLPAAILLCILSAYVPHAAGTFAPALIYPRWLFGVSLFTVLEYAPFFVLGLISFAVPGWLDVIRRRPRAKVFVFAITCIGGPWILAAPDLSPGAAIGVEASLRWLATLCLFAPLTALFADRRVLSQRLAAPAYSIYLIHHVLVTLFALGLSRWLPPAAGKFVLIVLVTTLFAYGFHVHVVARSATLRLLFNGQTDRPKEKAAPPLEATRPE